MVYTDELIIIDVCTVGCCAVLDCGFRLDTLSALLIVKCTNDEYPSI